MRFGISVPAFADFSNPRDLAELAHDADAGVTWWVEPVDPWRSGWSFEVPWDPETTVLMRERVRQGPPRL